MRLKNLEICTFFLSVLGSHLFVDLGLWNSFWFSVYLYILMILLRYDLYFTGSIGYSLGKDLP